MSDVLGTMSNNLSGKQGKAIRRRLLEENGNRCCFCLCVLNEWSATREHIIPRAVGGTDAQANLTVSCEDCNQARGSEDFYDFEARRDKRPDYVAPPLRQKKKRIWRLTVEAYERMARAAAGR